MEGSSGLCSLEEESGFAESVEGSQADEGHGLACVKDTLASGVRLPAGVGGQHTVTAALEFWDPPTPEGVRRSNMPCLDREPQESSSHLSFSL